MGNGNLVLRSNIIDLDWNDIKYFLSLKRCFRLSAAARQMGCSHVTVANRISALEKSLQAKLFIKDNQGFHLTSSGEQLVPYAEELERKLSLAIEQYREEHQIRFKIRIGVTEALGSYYLTPRLATWLKDKNIDVELVSLPRLTSITSGEVDISITLGVPGGQDVIKKKLTTYTLGIYAGLNYIESHSPIIGCDDLLQHNFIGYIEREMFSNALNYHQKIAPNLNIIFKSTTIDTQHKAVQAGLGLGILPNYVVQQDQTIIRVVPEIQFELEYWISTNKDLHRFKELKHTWDFIIDTCASDLQAFNP